jgi:F0F1-type ATP synthase assembly protein I
MNWLDDVRKASREAGEAQRRSSSNSAIGVQIAAAFGLFVFGGLKLDEALGTTPLFAIIGVLFALTAMVVLLMRFINPTPPNLPTEKPTPKP